MSKKILLFFPENPLKKDSGNKTRVIELLKYFKHKGFEVDFVGPQYKDFNQADLADLEATGWIRKAHLIHRKPKKNNPVSYWFSFKIPSLFAQNSKVMNFVTFNFRKEFDEILRGNTYDYIIISYVGWAELIKNNPLVKNAQTIIDTHDFATVQAKNDKGFETGKYFGTEIDRLDWFDQTWAISPDEAFVFGQFTRSKVKLIPFVIENHFGRLSSNPKWDLIYVASNNTHNAQSAAWFFEKVYPLLPANLKICVIGKIGQVIGDYPNVSKELSVPDLDAFYADSKIAICPMLSGSGVKIKVVEALSFGIPVVCNTRGVDGLSNKTGNGCLVTDDPKQFSQYIIELSQNPDFWNAQSQKAQSFFAEQFDLANAYRVLDEALEG